MSRLTAMKRLEALERAARDLPESRELTPFEAWLEADPRFQEIRATLQAAGGWGSDPEIFFASLRENPDESVITAMLAIGEVLHEAFAAIGGNP